MNKFLQDQLSSSESEIEADKAFNIEILSLSFLQQYNYNKVDNTSIFNLKSEDWSIRDLAMYKPKNIQTEVFKNLLTVPAYSDDLNMANRVNFEYVQIMHQDVYCENKKRIVLQINDRAAAVHMREEEEKKILMATINATASHDTRNPLNAIHA